MNTCTTPIDFLTLAEYWAAALPAPLEETTEEHLLACDACCARLREVVDLADAIRSLACSGRLRMIVSNAFLQHAAAQGLHVRQYAPLPGGGVHCTVTPEDDLLIGRLAADLRGIASLDVRCFDAQGNELGRLVDIPFNPNAPEVLFQESLTFAKGAPSFKMIARLVATGETGSERVLGEYTFNHTRTMPGPPDW